MSTATQITQTPRSTIPYQCGYWEYLRIWGRASKAHALSRVDYFSPGELRSPSGQVWRFMGLGDYSGTVRFWNPVTETWRNLSYGTVLRALLLGWNWKRDSDKPDLKYTISRWPDGQHYYVRDQDNETVTDGDREKWDTYEQADSAGRQWIEKQRKGKLS